MGLQWPPFLPVAPQHVFRASSMSVEEGEDEDGDGDEDEDEEEEVVVVKLGSRWR